MATIRASVVQCSTVYNDTPATLEKLHTLAKTAVERDGSALLVFPEAFIGGYPKFSNFGASVGTRSLEGRHEFVRYHKNAIAVPGPEVTRVADIARELDVFIVSGFIERTGGTLYCAVGFWHPKQGFLYRRRKLMPTASERLIWGFGDESDIRVVKAPFPTKLSGADNETTPGSQAEELVLSSAICWENLMPLLRTHYYTQGTQLHCVPTVDGRGNWESLMRTIAMEGRCFVLSACQMSGPVMPANRASMLNCLSVLCHYFAVQSDFPADHPVEGERDPAGIMIAGGSIIINPLGETLAGPLRGEEGVLTATLNLDDILAGKFDLDVVGHYSRPDIFKLSVRE